MARRRADVWDDLFEILRQIFSAVHPAWSIPVAVVFYFIPVLWFRHYIPVPQLQTLGYLVGALPAFICLAAGLGGWHLRLKRAIFLQQQLDISWLNKLGWQDFERQVGAVYRQRGYIVEECGGGGADGGVDLRLRRDGMTTVVQCKRWKTYKVGVKLVRELFGVMAAERADRAVFVTSGVYSDEALRFAQGKPIELIDGAQLAEMLRRFQESLKQSLEPSTVPSAAASQQVLTAEVPARPKCPRCGSDMVLRWAKKSTHAGREFWGCSQYSRTGCRGIRNVG